MKYILEETELTNLKHENARRGYRQAFDLIEQLLVRPTTDNLVISDGFAENHKKMWVVKEIRRLRSLEIKKEV